MKVKVRGIYSTALVNFLLKKGFIISEPSEKQKERFGLQEELGYDCFLYTPKNERNKIILSGECEKVSEILRELLWDSVFIERESNIKTAKILEIDERGCIAKVKIEEKEGIMKINKGEKLVKDKILVNILGEFAGKVLCTPVKKIEGKYIIAYREGYEGEIKGKIDELVERFPIRGWEVRIKENTSQNNINEIINELDRFKRKLEKEENPVEKVVEVYLGRQSKEILDEYRREVTYTIKNHHLYRNSNELTKIVDFLELTNIEERKYLEGIRRYIINKIRERKWIERVHVNKSKKLRYKFTVKSIEEIRDRIYLTLSREIKWKGWYDGLNLPAEEGDYAIESIMDGLPFFIIDYYDKDGNWKGRYININSPIEILPERVQYVDFEVDFIETNDTRKIVEEDLLEERIKEKAYNKRVREYVNKILEFLREEVEIKEEPRRIFEKYLNKFY